MKIYITGLPSGYEVEHLARLFYPMAPLTLTPPEPAEDCLWAEKTDTGLRVLVRQGEKSKMLEAPLPLPVEQGGETPEFALASLTYDLLRQWTGIRPPWGKMTGVRPVRIIHDLRAEGKTEEEIEQRFLQHFDCTPRRFAMAKSIADLQRRVLERAQPMDCSVYAGIPFCPSRCSYCSFVSRTVGDKSSRALVAPYVDCLCKELAATRAAADAAHLSIKTLYIGGGPPTSVNAQQLRQLMGTMAEQFDLPALEEFTVEAGYSLPDMTEVLNSCAQAINRKAKNATVTGFNVKDSSFTYEDGQNGLEVNQEATQAAAQAAVDAGNYDGTVTITVTETTPEMDKATLKSKFKRLATFTTTTTSNSNRNTNIRLCAQAISGVVVQPGEEFSVNTLTGQRTAAKGYKDATVIKNGVYVQEPGGGVCQVASTIYTACLYADLKVTERAPHMFTVTYVQLGMDATIYWGSLDYKFVNSTDHPLRIDASVSGGYVHIKLMGTTPKDKSYDHIVLHNEVIATRQPKTVIDGTETEITDAGTGVDENGNTVNLVVDKQGNKYVKGEMVNYAYTGKTVKAYRDYVDANGKVLKTELLHTDTYKHRDTSYKCTPYVEPEIPEEPDEPDPTDPTDPTDPSNPGTDIPTEPTEPTGPIISPWD